MTLRNLSNFYFILNKRVQMQEDANWLYKIQNEITNMATFFIAMHRDELEWVESGKMDIFLIIITRVYNQVYNL